VGATGDNDRGHVFNSLGQPGDHNRALQWDEACKQDDAHELTELLAEAAQAVLEGLVREQEKTEPDERLDGKNQLLSPLA